MSIKSEKKTLFIIFLVTLFMYSCVIHLSNEEPPINDENEPSITGCNYVNGTYVIYASCNVNDPEGLPDTLWVELRMKSNTIGEKIYSMQTVTTSTTDTTTLYEYSFNSFEQVYALSDFGFLMECIVTDNFGKEVKKDLY